MRTRHGAVPGGRPRRLLRCLLVGMAFVWGLGGTVGAVVPAAADRVARTASAPVTGLPSDVAGSTGIAGFRLRLRALSPAVPAPGGLFTVAGTITDSGPRTVRDVQVYLRLPAAPVTDRADLAVLAATPAGDPVTSGPLQVDHYAQLGTLRPGGRSRFSLTVPVDLLGLAAPGVYPLTVEVRATAADGSRIAAADVRTYLPWQIGTGGGAAAAASTGIETGWLVPLTTAAERISASVFVDGQLASSLGPTGRLGRVLDVLTRLSAAATRGGTATGRSGTTVQVAIDPMLVAEVEAMAAGYRVVDSASGAVTGRSAALPAASPGAPAPTPGRGTPEPAGTREPAAAAGAGHRSAVASRTPASASGRPSAPAPTGRGSPAAGTSRATASPPTASPPTASPPAAGTPTTGAPTTGASTPTTALQDADLPGVHTRAGLGRVVAASWLAELRQVVAGRTVFVLPWSDPDLGAVADPRTQLGATALTGSWSRGLELVRALGADPVPLAWPSLGTATASELALAGGSGAGAVLLPTVALSGSGAPWSGSTPDAVLQPAPAGSPTRVLRADTGLDTALAAPDTLLGRQSYLAETALLATEAAADRDAGRPVPHPVLAVLPRGWSPPAGAALQVLEAVTAPSWVRRAPALGATAPGPVAGQPQVSLRRHLAVLARQHGGDPAAATPQLTDAGRVALAALAGQTSTLGDLLTEPAAVRQGLRAQRLQLASTELVDQSVRWHRLAGAVSQTVRGIRQGVVLVRPNTVQLSSGTGRFPVIVANTLEQPVRVRLEMSTANRTRLGVASVPPVTLPADQRSTLQVQVDTHTHGLVEVRAVLEDAAGRALDAPLSFAVHSNSYDAIGWVIIIGAGALLFGATAVRLGRRIHVHARSRA